MFNAEYCNGIQSIDSEELQERRLSMIERAQKVALEESDEAGNLFYLPTQDKGEA